MPKRKKLINVREERNLLQEDVAKEIGVKQQTVSLLETGKRNPSIQLAKKLEVLFGVPMEDLFPDIFLNINTTKCNVNTQKSA